MDGKTRAQLLNLLPGAYPAVLARAVALVKRHRWLAQRYDSFAKAAEELAHDAIDRTMSGERKWNPAIVPELEVFLGGVMRSVVSAAAKSPELRTKPLSTIAVDEEDEASAADQSLGTLDDRGRGLKSPEEHVIEAERFSALVDRALDVAGDDANAAKIVEAAAAGCVKVAEFVAATGLSTEQVYAATRKMRERVRKGAKR